MKDNKKIIIVVILIIVLVGTIYFLNGAKKKESSQVSAVEQSETEAKLSSILNMIDGVGSASVMINENKEGITGVIIVCDGANSIMVRNDILNAVSTALNIEKNIIVIYSKNI